ncbi:hypothetical protein BpsM61_00064 [Bacillus phage vB_BpsM-61]|nr:hypothetical protein BpsM61_00064 [Bacillus phage vB_BpsM-61]
MRKGDHHGSGTLESIRGTVELENKEMQVESVDMELIVRDTTSRDELNQESPFYFTDLQFQPGYQKSGWVPETREMMKRLEFIIDEGRRYRGTDTNYRFDLIETDPKIWTPEELNYQRLFNFMGRGHEVIVIPNHLPERVFWAGPELAAQGLDRPVEILTTGIDFTIYPKDDYDLMRISTNSGGQLPEDLMTYPSNPGHPLNMRYTREFWFPGGSAGDELKCNASDLTASINGNQYRTNGIKSIRVAGTTVNIYKNKFHLIPRGSTRYRVEFYKMKDGVLVDEGIGYNGIATFKQWSYGRERL